jgi:hypothetical protein
VFFGGKNMANVEIYTSTIEHLNGPVMGHKNSLSEFPDRLSSTAIEDSDFMAREGAADSLMAAAHLNSTFAELFQRSGLNAEEYWASLLNAPEVNEDPVTYIDRLSDPKRVYDAVRIITDKEEAKSITQSAIHTFASAQEKLVLGEILIKSEQEELQVQGLSKPTIVANKAGQTPVINLGSLDHWTKTRKSGISRGPGSRSGQARRNNGRGWGILNGGK